MSAPERRDPQDAVFAPEELLRALPTPCYVYDEAQLRTRAARLRSAFSWSAGFRAWFPVRALPNPTVLRILREEGQGALCVTAGEYRLALASGFSPESIRFAPEFPTDAELAVPAADLVLDDGGLLQVAAIPKLSHIQIDHTAITYDGLLAVAGNSRIEPVAHEQFTKAQMEHFFHIQREKAKKPTVLDEQAAEECRRVLSAFFAEMTEWEQYMEQAGFEDSEAAPRLLAIWERYVSEKPRPGYRPLALSYSAQGTYNGERFLDAEQLTRNKLCIYTREKNTGFDRRFLMKRVDGSWKIDAVQERLDGWQRVGL